MRHVFAPEPSHRLQLSGKVAYHEFEGITLHAEEGARILASAGGKPVPVLRNHGPVTIGHTLAQAFGLMWLCVCDSLQYDPRYGAGQDALDALQRIVDCIDPSYRT